MSSKITPDRLADLMEIHQLKARYLRYVDTKQWEPMRDVFTDDFVFFLENAALPTTTKPQRTDADSFIENVSKHLQNAVTVHHGHMPEIEFTGDRTATGIWSMYDWVDDFVGGRAFHGFGHYHEDYLKGDDGVWRIKQMRLTRLRVDPVDPTQPSGDRPWPAPWTRSSGAA